MRLLFLDIDGVLNAHEPLDPEVMCGQIHKDKVMLLNDVLRQTGAFLAVSSAWRYIVHRGEMNLKGFEWLLRSHGIHCNNRFIGITRTDTHRVVTHWDGRIESWVQDNERGQQIADFMKGNGHLNELGIEHYSPENKLGPIEAYAVVDDLDLGISDCGHPFVQTDGAVGLRIEEAQQLVKLLTERPMT